MSPRTVSTFGLALALGVVALDGCASQRPATEIFLVVDADPALRSAGGSLHLRITGTAVGGAADVSLDRTVSGRELTWPISVGIVPRSHDATRGVAVEVELTPSTGAPVRASARTGFLPGETRVLRVSLEACCVAVACAARETCLACACASDAFDIRSLPQFGSDAAPLTGSDAGL